MKIQILASSSTGNAYIIDDLLIECGIKIKTLRKKNNFNLSSISACLLSHSHLDHSKSAMAIMKAGIDLYTSQGTVNILSLSGHRLHIIKALNLIKINSWTILPFDIIHNDKEPLGFLISKNNEKLLFAIDTAYIKYKFLKLNYIMIECNYQSDILNNNIKNGNVPLLLKKRLINSHFNLNNVINFLKSNDLSSVIAIYLMHLSYKNSNALEIKETIQKITGKMVYIC